jgi:hypothetical protein
MLSYCLHSPSPLNLHRNLSKKMHITSDSQCITTTKMHITSTSQMHHNHKNSPQIHFTDASQPQKCTSHTLTSTKMHITSAHICKSAHHHHTSTKMHITSAHIHKSAHHITKMHIPYTHIHENAHQSRSYSQKCTSHPVHSCITSTKKHITSTDMAASCLHLQCIGMTSYSIVVSNHIDFSLHLQHCSITPLQHHGTFRGFVSHYIAQHHTTAMAHRTSPDHIAPICHVQVE